MGQWQLKIKYSSIQNLYTPLGYKFYVDLTITKRKLILTDLLNFD